MKDMRAFWCPQCDKQRLLRPTDHVVSREEKEYKTKTGSTIRLFIDICEFCKHKNNQKFFEPSREDIRRILKTITEESQLSEDESLEELL